MDKKKKVLLYSGIAVITIFLAIYLAFSLFFMNHYYFGTTIGGISCGGKSPKEVQTLLSQEAQHYVLTIQGREGEAAQVTAPEIELQFMFDDTLNQMVKNQESFAWPVKMWMDSENDMPILLEFNDTLLNQRLDSMLLFDETKMKAPVNAYIGEYDSAETRFPIIEEYPGTTLDIKKSKEIIYDAINHMEEIVDLDVAECYRNPTRNQNDEALRKYCDELNRFVTGKVTYQWNGVEEIIDGNVVCNWLEIDEEKQQVSLNEDMVREYINQLSRKNDTFGKEREFTTTEGKTLTVKHGNYGWRVDREKETENLIDYIKNNKTIETKPEYLYTANVEGQDDIGESYVEINLSTQHLYLYVDGELITETDFVSGNVAKGFQTPEGVYGLTYKTKDATLRGPGYVTPVKYWMPFNGNVGMHDATWRREFGGEIFKKNGSHGCVNLPKSEAEKIYEQVYKGFPVICFRDEEYEKENGGSITELEPSAEEEQISVPEDGRTPEELQNPVEQPQETEGVQTQENAAQ